MTEVDFDKVENIHLTNNEFVSEKEVEEEFYNLGHKNVQILKDHISHKELYKYVYSFFEYNGSIFLGIGSDGNPIEYIEVKPK